MRLVDADALKEDCRMANDCKDCKTYVRDCEYDRIYTKMDFCGWLDDAPTVDAVPVRHGRWIYEERDRLDHETDDGRVFRTEKWWKCSECGNAKGYIGHKPSDKFCSKCGADMREDGDGNG